MSAYLGWIVAVVVFASGTYWRCRAGKAEARAAMWQEECRQSIAAVVDAEKRRHDAETRSIALLVELKRAVDVVEAIQKRDTLTASIAYSARRLH